MLGTSPRFSSSSQSRLFVFFFLPSFLLLCPSHSKMSCKGAPLSTRCRRRQHRSRTTNNHILLFLVAVIEVAVCDSRSLLRLICFNSMLGLHISLRSPVGRCLAFLCSPVLSVLSDSTSSSVGGKGRPDY